jgi:septal ring factor EnvC (AmiA/AmiB activator)
MKAFPAVIFGLVITAAIGATMFVIGSNALLNKNSVPVANAPASSSPNVAPVNSSADQQQFNQMQQLINQYQAREKQYQQELQQAAQRLNDANAQLTQSNQQLDQLNQSLGQYQQLFQALQDRGIIRVGQDGSIILRGGG